MTTTLFLRIASVLLFIQAVLHTVGGVFGKPTPGSATVAVQAMKSNQFLLTGNMRSYWDFFIGFGLAISISCAAEAIILWQLASIAKTDSQRIRPILFTFLIAYVALGINAYTFFFPGPVIAEILIVACLGLAIANTGRTQPASFEKSRHRTANIGLD
jgi:hypothetical protein